MNQGLLSLSGVFLLILLALLTMHEWETLVPNQQKQPANEGQNRPPMLQLSGIQSTAFNENGQKEFELQAKHMEWQEDNATSQLSEPALFIPNAEGSWQLTAHSGMMDDAEQHIALSGDVKVQQTGINAIEFNTDKLDFYGKRQEAITSAVVINTAQGTISAGAMTAKLDENILQFSNGVETHYAPAIR